jgi:ABC-type uncharacterized transport system
MSTAETPAPSFLNILRTQRHQLAIGLVVAGVILGSLSVWWGIWGFGRSAASVPAKSEGKLLPDEPPAADAAKADDGKALKSPDYRIAAVWAGAMAVLAFMSATWLFTRPPDPISPTTSARIEVLTFGGVAGLITTLCGAFLGYFWHQSLKMWVGGGDAREAKWVLYAAAIFMGGLLLMFASLQLARSEQRTNAMLRRILYGFNSVFVGLLLLIVLIAANVVSFMWVPTTLATNDTAFTGLAEPSKRLIQSLDRPVHVYLILHEHQTVPVGRGLSYDTMYADCRGLLTECEDQSKHFHATFLSPTFDEKRVEELFDRLKIKKEDQELGMVIAVGDNEEAFSFVRAAEVIDVDQGRNLVFQGENKLMTELMYLIDDRAKQKVYFTQQRGELTVDAGESGEKSCSAMVQYLRDRKMSVEPLTFDEAKPAVPEDAAVVVVAGLRRTLAPDDPMLVALREYLRRPNSPGKLILFLPAFRNTEGKVSPTGLEGLLADYGIAVDAEHRLVLRPGQYRLPSDYVVVAPLARIDPDLARVVGLSEMAFRDARPVRPVPSQPSGQFRVTPLFGTKVFTWVESDFSVSIPLRWEELKADATGQKLREKQYTPGPVPVAAAAVETVQGEKPKSRPRLIVFGSDTFLQDQSPIPAGTEEYRQLLFSGCIDWLRERDAGIGIAPRKVGVFTLEKPIDWPSQLVLFALLTSGIAALGIGVWLSRRR